MPAAFFFIDPPPPPYLSYLKLGSILVENLRPFFQRRIGSFPNRYQIGASVHKFVFKFFFYSFVCFFFLLWFCFLSNCMQRLRAVACELIYSFLSLLTLRSKLLKDQPLRLYSAVFFRFVIPSSFIFSVLFH